MPIAALILVVVAAFAHSTWNLLAKRAAHCRNLLWFTALGGAIFLLPAAVWAVRDDWSRLGFLPTLFMAASAVIHIGYFESLRRGYQAGDLSVVYPLARGTGPLFSFFGAILVLHERPTAFAIGGALLVVCGILTISDGVRTLLRGADRAGIAWGTITGILIACYTVVDGYAVKILLVSPILITFTEHIFRAVVLSAQGWRQRDSLVEELRKYWKELLGISILTPLGYILVLFAVRIAPLSRVAPAREMSMMIGAYFGTRLLNEGNARRRIFASLLIALGVAGLVLG